MDYDPRFLHERYDDRGKFDILHRMDQHDANYYASADAQANSSGQRAQADAVDPSDSQL